MATSTTNARPEPLGVFGGTFDPVHLGHLRLAEEAAETLQLERVIWIPAGRPPHRGAPATSAAQRLAMVERAIADNPRFQLDDAEVRAEAPSYSVLTLARLRAAWGAQRPLVLLLGADAWNGLTGWHRWRELFELAHIAVASRPGAALEQVPAELQHELHTRRINCAADLRQAPAGRILPYTISALDISATSLRSRIARGASVRYLMSPAVIAYIEMYGLYRPPAAAPGQGAGPHCGIISTEE
ncbi:MAG: nicotinate-nucleotide adenylyltransferase [Rhodocyclaceae bacterium]|nr:nicotinate-nucleotide adenylyltransferase [Rhodocyclaceae bacterium]